MQGQGAPGGSVRCRDPSRPRGRALPAPRSVLPRSAPLRAAPHRCAAPRRAAPAAAAAAGPSAPVTPLAGGEPGSHKRPRPQPARRSVPDPPCQCSRVMLSCSLTPRFPSTVIDSPLYVVTQAFCQDKSVNAEAIQRRAQRSSAAARSAILHVRARPRCNIPSL